MPSSASQRTPLAIVSSAVAGDGLEGMARAASEALGQPVAIVVPSLGGPVVWPAETVPSGVLGALASAVIAGPGGHALAGVERAMPIRIGPDVVGVVATIAGNGDRPASVPGEDLAWLEAAAAAAAIARLMLGEDAGSPRALVQALLTGPRPDLEVLIEQGRRLGCDLGSGVVAVCARGADPAALEAQHADAPFVAELGPGRVVGLVALAGGSSSWEREAGAFAGRLRDAGGQVGVSAPRRAPALVGEAIREAMLLAELLSVPEAGLPGQEDTYRLLIGVLLRDPGELEQLRASTIAPLLAYDAEHETELLSTLGTFLARHGSTTEAAEAMQLHRHTVGYRLSRIHEVSGLSPYESDGRERLSLGLKAAQILAAQEQLPQPG